MASLKIAIENEDDTRALGALLAKHLPERAVVGLMGTLGAGKTRLVQALAAAVGVDPADVVSPTFVLMQPYEGQRRLYHVDAYRLKDEDEFLELGPEEWFASDALTLVEWADRVADCLPDDSLWLTIEVVDPTRRTVSLSFEDSRFDNVADAVRRRFASEP